MRRFKRWISIEDPWQPDVPHLQLLGTLSVFNGRYSTPARRQVRCSPQLVAFTFGHTTYRHPLTGRNPEGSLQSLRNLSFLRDPFMFKNANSPYHLLCSSHMILDMAFVRAVLLASAWLGPEVVPAGYLPTWPPPEGDAGLSARSAHA